MGHTRLGKIPKSRKWTAVVETLSQPDDTSIEDKNSNTSTIAEVAKRTIDAAQEGLEKAITDKGLVFTFYLLTQVALASRTNQWENKLRELGISLPSNPTIYDLTAEIQIAIDDHLYSHARTSDVSEMAQKAAGEVIIQLAADKSKTLFGEGGEDLRLAIRELSTKTGFANLGQHFFGAFTAKFLNFYLSRITAAEVNGPRFHQLGDISVFNDALKLHCNQSAKIVHDFSGEWYSKTEYTRGISLENSAGFVAIAMKKLKAELQQQGVEE